MKLNPRQLAKPIDQNLHSRNAEDVVELAGLHLDGERLRTATQLDRHRFANLKIAGPLEQSHRGSRLVLVVTLGAAQQALAIQCHDDVTNLNPSLFGGSALHHSPNDRADTIGFRVGRRIDPYPKPSASTEPDVVRKSPHPKTFGAEKAILATLALFVVFVLRIRRRTSAQRRQSAQDHQRTPLHRISSSGRTTQNCQTYRLCVLDRPLPVPGAACP